MHVYCHWYLKQNLRSCEVGYESEKEEEIVERNYDSHRHLPVQCRFCIYQMPFKGIYRQTTRAAHSLSDEHVLDWKIVSPSPLPFLSFLFFFFFFLKKKKKPKKPKKPQNQT